MRKFIILLALFLMVTISPSFASVGVKLDGTNGPSATDFNFKGMSGFGSANSLTQDGSTYTFELKLAGVGSTGGVSSVSTVTAVDVTASYVRKVLTTNSDATYTAGTMADGKAGQMLTVYATGTTPLAATGSYIITPTTATGFSSVELTEENDSVSFLFVDSTTGWVITSYVGTINIVR